MMFPELLLLLLAGASAAPVNSNDNESHIIKTWETTGLFEGDIMEPPGTLVHRNVMRDKKRRWPGAVIPYIITKDFTDRDRAIIRRAMTEIESHSCVKFRKRTVNDFNYLLIEDHKQKRYCSSMVGRVGAGAQPVNLNRAIFCVSFKVVVHELMHAVGFQHQHSVPNRDNYVNIIWENIREGYADNFYKLNDTTVTDLGIPYDYKSVMHYDPYEFSVNGKPTIVPRVKGAVIHHDGHLSKGDMQKLHIMYNCYTKWAICDPIK